MKSSYLENEFIYQRRSGVIERLVGKKSFWIFFFAVAFTFPLVKSLTRKMPNKLPEYYQVPEFQFTNEYGKPFGSKDLKGRIYLANFFFTSCPTVCPGIMKKTQLIQKRLRGLGSKVGIVSFTVDPETDTSQVLYKHSRKYKSNPRVWTFLTGKKEKLHSFLTTGLKVSAGSGKEFKENSSPYDIAHSEKVLLVDEVGKVRGIYSLTEDSINRLMINIGLLANLE